MSGWLGTALRRRRPRTGRSLRWSVVVSSPRGEAGEQWGDTWFGRDLVEALQERNQQARLVHRGAANSAARDQDDVVLVLRGLTPVVPRPANESSPTAGPTVPMMPTERTARGTRWMMWVISHPAEVTEDELTSYDAVFAASNHWSRAQHGAVAIHPLLQATNPRRFRPQAGKADTGASVLFVGSTRGQFRPVVRDAVTCGADLSVYGVGWEGLIPDHLHRGVLLANPELPKAYASAGVVLNDHWPDMAAEGFLSNRLFDAVACGARVISDQAAGLDEVFGDVVQTYLTPDELCPMVTGDFRSVFPGPAVRREAAERIRAEHSFGARADLLIEVAQGL